MSLLLLSQSTGWTALFFTAKQGNAEIIKLLLIHGADVDIRDKVRIYRTRSYSMCVVLVLLSLTYTTHKLYSITLSDIHTHTHTLTPTPTPTPTHRLESQLLM